MLKPRKTERLILYILVCIGLSFYISATVGSWADVTIKALLFVGLGIMGADYTRAS